MDTRLKTAAAVALLLAFAGTQMGGCELPTLPEEDSDDESGVLAGTWRGQDFTVHCQSPSFDVVPPSSFTLALSQNGTLVTGTLAATHPTAGDADGTLSGTLTGTSFTFTLTLTSSPPAPASPCNVTLEGTGTLGGGALNLTFTGSADCCASASGGATATLQ